jgi:6-phosphogluconolactonase (cycloisomerase 2 family)
MNGFRTLAAVLAVSLTFVGCGAGKQTSTIAACPSSRPSGTASLELLYSAPLSDLLNTSVTATIDPNTGGFSSVLVTTVPAYGCAGGIITVDAKFLYISIPENTCGAYASALLGYSLDQSTGAPTALPTSFFSSGILTSPQGMATLPNTNLVYVADAGRIDAFCVDSDTGSPTPIPGSPFASGSNPQLAVDPSGKFLYASDDDDPGGVLAFTVGFGGGLTPISGSPFAIPGQTNSNSQPFGIVDTGKFVYTALLATNQIAAFSIDSQTGVLAPVPGSPFAAGTEPIVLALANNFLYAVNNVDGSISGYSINPDTGALTPVPGSPFGNDGFTLVVDPSGKYLYVSLSVGINGFNIDPTTGALTQGLAGVSNDGPLWITIAQLP